MLRRLGHFLCICLLARVSEACVELRLVNGSLTSRWLNVMAGQLKRWLCAIYKMITFERPSA